MKSQENKNLSQIRPSRIILPVLLGLAVVGYFIIRDLEDIDFSLLSFSKQTVVFILLAFLLMIFRDLGYIIRLRVLSSGELSWKKCLRIIFLWEFGSAITPSAIGGTGLATLFIWKEGLPIGKSTSIVMATSFLDELYFSLMFPLIFIFFKSSDLFIIQGAESLYNKFFYFALAGYLFKLLWTIFVAYSLFLNPKLIGRIVGHIFNLRFFRKWRDKSILFAEDFKQSSVELKVKPFSFWIKAGLATFFTWTSRYWVLNLLILALVGSMSLNGVGYNIDIFEHLLIFARQLIMWIMMIVMPSPGGSGFVEAVFQNYMADFIPVAGFAIFMALSWRLVTYYPYLIIGSIISPKWVAKHFIKKKKKI